MVSITDLYQAEMGARWHYLQPAVLQSTKECLAFESQGLQRCFQMDAVSQCSDTCSLGYTVHIPGWQLCL
jgi:hypothetical protein